MPKKKISSHSEIKEKKRRNPYDRARSTSCNESFWDMEQQEMYHQICKEDKVFRHKYVKWSEIPNDFINYEAIGLKDLLSYNSNWDWNKDIVQKFYSTLFINSDRTEMTFMVNCECHFATKKDLEQALGIKPTDGSIVLHDLTEWKEEELSSLFVDPNNVVTKRVRDLKIEVDLIQKINRCTLLPRIGNRSDCTDILLRLAHAIYKGTPFDVANFLLSEMCNTVENLKENQRLPYAPYIFSLLRHLKIITDDNIGDKCYAEVFQGKEVIWKVAAASIKNVMQLRADLVMKGMDEFEEKVGKQLDKFGKQVEDVVMLQKDLSVAQRLRKDVEMPQKDFSVAQRRRKDVEMSQKEAQVYTRRKRGGSGEATDL